MITFQQLLGLDAGAFLTSAGELQNTSNRLATAGSNYRAEVVTVLESGKYWEDDVNLRAAMVAEVMALAFETESTRLTASSVALGGLAMNLKAAQDAANNAVRDILAAGHFVDADGVVKEQPFSPTSSPQSMSGPNPTGNVDRFQGVIDAIVAWASSADDECAKSIDVAASAEVYVTTMAGGDIVGRARDALAAARGQLGRVQETVARVAEGGFDGVRIAANAEYGLMENVFGFLGKMWESHIGENLALVKNLVGAAFGNDAATHELETYLSGLASFDLGKLVDFGDFSEGRPGAGVAQVIGLISPFSKVHNLRTLAKREDIPRDKKLELMREEVTDVLRDLRNSAASPPAPSVKTPDNVPPHVRELLEHTDSHRGRPPQGYADGGEYRNHPTQPGGQLLPRVQDGSAVDYTQYDVYPDGVDRGRARMVVGSDGSAYFSNDGCKTFTRIR